MRLVLIDTQARTYTVFGRFAPGFPLKRLAEYVPQGQPTAEDVEAIRVAECDEDNAA